MPEFKIGHRWIGDGHPPLVIAEAGIHHGGDMERARMLIDEARWAGAEVVKFQTHIPGAEMTDAHPWRPTIATAALTHKQELELKCFAEHRGMKFLSTPFSLPAVDRLGTLGVDAIKIGSGECSHLQLVEHAARLGKPVIMSTGMHSMAEVRESVAVLRDSGVPFALLHCTSEYPTQYRNVRLGAMKDLRDEFPDAVIGLSCHSLGIYTALAAVALGASIIEKHFKARQPWNGPDAEVSLTAYELRDLINGARVIHDASGGIKAGRLPCEADTARLALHCVATRGEVREGQALDRNNTELLRAPGGIPASAWESVIGRKVKRHLPASCRITEADLA